jgi:prepilin-type N-terminal cleavage/methylation domain-containing protein/prepilin-type processing-associated H-X9-DG protein
MRFRAFTLVELMVTVAIISTLLGLLLPALSAVQTSALQMKGQSNLRQMGIAAQQYSALWDAWPTAIRYEEVGGVIHRVAWDWVTVAATDELVSPGPLWTLTDNPDEVMQCPAYHGPSNSPGDPFTGYNYNTSFIGGESFNQVGWDNVRRGVPPHACVRASTTAIFGCGGWVGGANKYMRAPTSPNGLPLETIYAGAQAFHYNGSTNVAYIDGHVGSVAQPKTGTYANEQLVDGILDHPDNGFLSDDASAYDPR